MIITKYLHFGICCAILSGCCICTPSRGSTIGHITMLSEDGVFYKSIEGQMIIGGLSDGSGVIDVAPVNRSRQKYKFMLSF